LFEVRFGLVREEAVVGQVGSVRGKRSLKRKQKCKQERGRSPQEAVGVLWMVIDEAKSSMHDPLTTSEEKRHWAKVLTDTVGVLNKAYENLGEKSLEDEDLGSLLARIPRPMQAKIARRALICRRISSEIGCSATWVLRLHSLKS
jgi:hypothetical protein